MGEPKHLLDAETLWAYLRRAPGYEEVREAIREGAAIDAVSLAAVLARVRASGRDQGAIHLMLRALGLEVVPFEEADALEVAGMDPALPLEARAARAVAKRLGLRLVEVRP